MKPVVYLEEMPEGIVIVTNEMVLIGTKKIEGDDE
jgi:hypothetical protein